MHIHLFQSIGPNSDELIMLFAQELEIHRKCTRRSCPAHDSITFCTKFVTTYIIHLSTATGTQSCMFNLANALNSEGKCNVKYCSACQSHSYVKDQLQMKRESTLIYFYPKCSIGKKIKKIHMMYIFLCFVRNILNRSSYLAQCKQKGLF